MTCQTHPLAEVAAVSKPYSEHLKQTEGCNNRWDTHVREAAICLQLRELENRRRDHSSAKPQP